MAERPGLRPEKRVEYRFDEDRTLRTDGFPEACVGWRSYRLTAAPPAGRLPDEAVPGTTWVSPPVLHPGRPTLRRSPDPVRPPCLRSEIPLHPLPPPLRIAGRASLPCDGTGRLWGRREVRRADDGVFSGRAVKSAGWRRGKCRQSTDCEHRAAGRSRSVDRRDGHGQQVARFVADPDGGLRVAQDGQPRGGDQGVMPPPPRLPPPPPRPLRPRRDQTASSSVPGSGLQAPWGC